MVLRFLASLPRSGEMEAYFSSEKMLKSVTVLFVDCKLAKLLCGERGSRGEEESAREGE